MSPKYQQIASQALELDAEDRFSLVAQLLQSFTDDEPILDNYWREVVKERVTEYEEGHVEAIPEDVVFREAREAINEVRLSRQG